MKNKADPLGVILEMHRPPDSGQCNKQAFVVDREDNFSFIHIFFLVRVLV